MKVACRVLRGLELPIGQLVYPESVDKTIIYLLLDYYFGGDYILVIFDIDGVVLKENKPVNNVIKSINRLYENGISYTFSTGRGYAKFLEATRNINCRLPIILEDGGKIVSPNGLPIKYHSLNKETINNVLTLLNSKFLIYAKFCPINSNKYRFFTSVNDIKNEIVNSQKYYCEAITDSSYEFVNWLLELNGVRLTLKMQALNKRFVYINADGINKGTAIIELASILKVPLNEIIAIGNDYNDISMFKVGLAEKIAILSKACPSKLIENATNCIELDQLPDYLNSLILKQSI